MRAISQLPLSEPWDLRSEFPRERFDAVIVGSDEVWNLRHPWYGGYPAFYGAGLNADRLVSYAASFGNHDAEDGLDEVWSRRLARFDAVAVRDANSRDIILRSIRRDPPVVLDPCLQFLPDAESDPVADEGKDFVVYGHSFPPSFAAAIVEAAARRRARLVSIGYRNDWADEQRLDCGPEDFAAAMKSASAVVTNFFHGCVFALAYGRPFVCLTSPYRSNKIRDLTELLGCPERIASAESTCSDIERLLADVPDAAAERIRDLRLVSDSYLHGALGAP